MLPSRSDHRLDLVNATPWRHASRTSAQPESSPRPRLAVARSLLEVTECATPSGMVHRAQLPLGRERYGDTVRIARAFTSLIASVTETSSVAENSHVSTSTDPAGNTIVELQSSGAGIPAAFVFGLLQPVLETHVEVCLEGGRALEPDADLTVCVDITVARSHDEGMVLRVVLYVETNSLPSLGPTTPEADLAKTRMGTTDAAPRRFASGFHVRDGSSLDLEEAIAFATEPA
jgi:hypothetical protein